MEDPQPVSGSPGGSPPGSRAASPDHRQNGGNWQQDKEATACPRCRAAFTATFRRHHCRQCGGLVCDDCSKSRLWLPRLPAWGKVRVCDPCASQIGHGRTSGFEEDLKVNSEIVAQLRSALGKSYEECEASKRVLLELEAEASGDASLLERYAADPESDEHAFAALRDKVQQRWSGLLASLDEQVRERAELQERQRQALERRDSAVAKRRELQAQRASLDSEMAEMARCEARRDELVRQQAELEQAVTAARRRVRELELERKEHQERQQQQQRSRWRTGRVSQGSAAGSAPGSPAPSPQPFTISTGRQDPLLAGRGGRLEGCRRSCQLM